MLLYCGDSHTRPFEFNIFEHKEDDPRLLGAKMVWRPGATAGGFPRQNARRGLREAFVAAQAAEPPKLLCFNLGQVDVDVGYYYASMTANLPAFEDWITQRYEDYIHFCKTFDAAVVIKGLNPTCLISNTRIRAYVRRNTKGSFDSGPAYREAFESIKHLMHAEHHADRNALANLILKDLCDQHDLPFFDIRQFAGSASHSGVARDDLVMPRLDVHLSDSLGLRSAYRNGLKKALRTIAF